jgi:hypothetical protein
MVDLLFTALCTSLNHRFTCTPRVVSARPFSRRTQNEGASYDVNASGGALHEVHARDESGAGHVGLAIDDGLLQVALGLAQHGDVVDLAEHADGVGPAKRREERRREQTRRTGRR